MSEFAPYKYHSPSLQPPSRRSRLRFLPLVLFGVMVWYMVSHYVLPHERHLQAQAAARNEAAVITAAHNKALAALPAKIHAVTAQYPDTTFSVSITDLVTNAHQHIGSSASFDAASIGKMLTATDYLRSVENNEHALAEYLDGDTAQNWLQRLIVDSDDTAWQILNTTLTHAHLSAYAASLDLGSYDPDKNTLTSDDAAELLQKLYKGTLLNKDHTTLLLSYMQRANYRDYIVAAAPAGSTVYHKVGWDGNVLHDAAIIKNGSQAYVLVIYSTSDSEINWDARTKAMQDITRIVGSVFTS